MSANHTIELAAQDISWSVGKKTLVDQLSIAARTGEIVGLLGPNGSGKTTFLKTLARTLTPESGQRELKAKDYGEWEPKAFARTLAVVQQQATTEQDLQVEEVIDLGRIPHRNRWVGQQEKDKEIIAQAAQSAGIAHLLDRSWATLSGGEQQRTHLARAFAQEPEVLILDEPTNHLDISKQLEMLQLLRGSQLCVIVALHDLNLAARYCDRVMVLKEGKTVAMGTPQEVLTAELIESVYGVRVRILYPEPQEPPLIQFLEPI